MRKKNLRNSVRLPGYEYPETPAKNGQSDSWKSKSGLAQERDEEILEKAWTEINPGEPGESSRESKKLQTSQA